MKTKQKKKVSIAALLKEEYRRGADRGYMRGLRDGKRQALASMTPSKNIEAIQRAAYRAGYQAGETDVLSSCDWFPDADV